MPVPTPTPLPGHPVITGLTNPVLVGTEFTINGRGFTKKPLVNFFVATAKGPVNEGPLTPSSISATKLVVPVPATASQGDGFVSVQVVNTDSGFLASNLGYALLQGSAAAGLPSITGLNGHGLAATSKDPNFATINIETLAACGASAVDDRAAPVFDIASQRRGRCVLRLPRWQAADNVPQHRQPQPQVQLITYLRYPQATPHPGPDRSKVSNAEAAYTLVLATRARPYRCRSARGFW